VHGGAGDVPPARRPAQAEGCRVAALAGGALLGSGGRALDAVQRAVEILEDDLRYNAGTGACLTADGRLELDAAIMDGATLKAGAVCALSPFKHPIAIARAVLDRGAHVLYAAEGARAFAEEAGFVPAEPAEMITEAARKSLAQVLARGATALSAGGTVGAVARDVRGNVAAATSTGGMIGKRPGRVGDSPILGAGTYADNLTGAASATGEGEGILRVTLTAQIQSWLRSGMTLEAAARSAIELLGQRVAASGGVIVVAPSGELAFARSTATMSWAAAWEGAEPLAGA
jgi:L-asparaginase / beta-aspartyl-peptidase